MEKHLYHANPQETAISSCTTSISEKAPPLLSLKCASNSFYIRSTLFVEKSNDPNQFAYKQARSTLDAVGLLAHTIAKSLDGGLKVFKVAFVDCSNVFNTITCSQFLNRLTRLGAPSRIARCWLSYFTYRRQRV